MIIIVRAYNTVVNISPQTSGSNRVIVDTGGSPSGGTTGYISAGGSIMSLGTAVFSNANGMSFGIDGHTLTASYTVPTVPSQTQFVFSNANGLTFGTTGSTVTGSYTVPAQTEYFFSNDNGVTFGTSGSVVTASAVGGGGGGGGGTISAGESSISLGQVVFSNSNNVSFGLNGSTITGSIDTTPFRATANDSQLRFTSADSQLRFTSADSQLQFTSANSNFLGTAATQSFRFTSADTQLQFTSANSNFRFTSADSQLRFTSADTQIRFTSADSQLQFTSANSIFLGTAATQSFRHTSADSQLRFTSADSQLQFTSANTNFLGTAATQSFRFTSQNTQLQFTSANTKFIQEWQLVGAQTAGTTSSAQGSQLYLSAGNMMTLSGNSNTIIVSMNSASLLGTGATASFRFTSADTQLRFTSADTQLQFTSANTNFLGTAATQSFQFTSATSAITSNALNTSASRVFNIIAATNNTGGGTASLSSNVSFSNVNNISFYTSAGNAIVASFSQSADTGKAGTGFTSAGANITMAGTLNSNGLSLSVSAATIAPAPIVISAGASSGSISSVVFSNSNNHSFGLNGSTITVSKGNDRVSYFDNMGQFGNSAQAAMVMKAMQASTLWIFPLTPGDVFPGDITASTVYLNMAISGSTNTMSSAQTSNFTFGVYTISANQTQLALASSATYNFSTNAGNANFSTNYAGNRFLAFTKNNWGGATEPVFSQNVKYFGAFLWSSAGQVNNVSNSVFGNFAFMSMARSGTIGASTANSTWFGLYPAMGHYSANTVALPASIGISELNKQVSSFNFMPHVILNAMTNLITF